MSALNAPGATRLPSLLPCLMRLAQLQRASVDRLALQQAADAAGAEPARAPRAQLATLAQHLQLRAPRWLDAPSAEAVPALLFAGCGARRGQWGILQGKNGQDQWVSQWWNDAAQCWDEQADASLAGHACAMLRLDQREQRESGDSGHTYRASASPVFRMIRQEVLSHKTLLRDAVLGGIVINVVALTSSFYSMQVYDRVVPTGASQTLLVLTLGVVLACLFELAARHVRSRLYERLIDQVDQRLARAVYLRFLAIRMDQLPHSVGGLAAQMRGYETVRGFFTTITTNVLVDAPFALVFALVIFGIAGPLALIPALFFVLSVGTGWYDSGRIDAHASDATQANNLRTGLLVETVEGAEIIKSGQGGWRMLARWMRTTDVARENELKMRAISEHSQHLTGSFQQLSYILLVASGALLVSQGQLTMGGLIACSILSGRVLAPIAMIPAQLMQWAQTKAALRGLDRLWALEDDHHGQQQPVTLQQVRGHYRFEKVSSGYGGAAALTVPDLAIAPGEKIGVLGPVGAGKTTLLRLLSGMYKPQQGRILLDDVDLAHLAKPALAESIGYVPQDGRLFSGTLRENLILGQLDPGDDVILAAARQTGLLQAVIARHPHGLQQAIHEGGSGLSGGQRQLLNLTRAFLRRPAIWLLDEPTASMDRSLELQVLQALKQAIAPQHTLILVTHKPEMLELVDRLIVISNNQIVLDGPKALVLQRLQAAPPVREQAA